MATYRPFTEQQFLHLGLSLRSNGNSDRWKRIQLKSQVENFTSTYMIHPRALATLWHDLQTTTVAEARIAESVRPEHILVVYRWLTSYESEKALNTLFGYGKKAIRAWCKDITHSIALLRQIKVSLCHCGMPFDVVQC